MSEEEAKEILLNLSVDKYIDERKLNIKDVEAIITLLDLYQKEKEKNKKMFNQYEKRVNELEREIAINSISKDEIIKEDEDINIQNIKELDKILKIDDLIAPYNENEEMMWTEIIKEHNKINDLIKAVKKLDKEINNE